MAPTADTTLRQLVAPAGPSKAVKDLRVADAMATCPTVHGPTTTVGELRAFFRDDHVHAALLVEGGRLIGWLERGDLLGQRNGRVAITCPLRVQAIAPDTSLTDAFAKLRRTGRRRLPVTTDAGLLIGLLCLKASGKGFCSNADIARRRDAEPAA